MVKEGLPAARPRILARRVRYQKRMPRLRLILLIAGTLLTGAIASPVSGQEQDVARGSYPFFQRNLTIAVNAAVPGELQIVRARAARVDIAALASPGVASFALGGWRGDELVLTAAGAQRAVFIVTVPERVYVSVKAPGASRSLGAFTPIQTIQWGSEAEATPALHPSPPAPPVAPRADGYYPVYGASTVPTSVHIPSLAAVERIDVHMRGSSFRLAATRPLQVTAGQADPLVIALAGEPLDLRFELPAETRSFQIVANGDVVLSVRDGRVTRYCTPAIAQDLGAEGVLVTLTPLRGRLDCGAETRQAATSR